MNDDTKEILQAITQLTAKVEEYHGTFREFRGKTENRVEALECDTAQNRFWSRVHAVVILPVVAGLHQLAQHWGLTAVATIHIPVMLDNLRTFVNHLKWY